MSNPHFINDEDLHAYVDGMLEEARAAQVRDALADNPGLAERVARFQADKAMFKTVYAPLADRPVPKEWISQAHRRTVPSWRQAGVIAAALLVMAAGVLAWRELAPGMNRDVVEMALDARQDSPVEARDVGAGSGAATEQDNAELRRTLASNVQVPDLSRMGYKLQGLNFYDKAAEILYRGPQGQLFTLYIKHSDGHARFDQFERRGLRVCIWQDDQISTVMAGNVSAAAMQRLATLSYTGLTS